MIDDLQHYNRDKSMLLKSYVEKRLSKSVNTYYEQMIRSAKELSSLDEKKVLKRLAK